ncbi:MAG: AMIN domain-containing protein [Desulfuromusa sp.]|nr:AMIN domain-containing protein [Desulfuromusa sp.]
MKESITSKVGIRSVSLLLGILLCTVAPFTSYAAELQTIKYTSTPELTRVILQLNESVRFQIYQLPASQHESNRCYIDLNSTRQAQSLPQRMMVNDSNLIKIRSGVHATTLRVVLDLEKNRTCAVSVDNNSRIIMDVTPSLPSASTRVNSRVAPLANPLTEPLPKILDITAEETKKQSQTTKPIQQQPLELLPAEFAGLTSSESSFTTWGWLQGFSAVDFKSDPAEDDKMSRLKARLGVDWRGEQHDNYSLQGHVSLDIDHIFYDNAAADNTTDVNPHEAYLQLSTTNWDFSLGKQRVRWGKSDQLSPLDTINADDLRQSMTVNLEERKIPSWMARLRWYGQRVTIETIIQPWFQESELEYFDSDWALYRNLRQSITENPTLPVSIKDYAAAIRVDEEQPGNSLENISAATRLTWKTDQADFGLSYRYGWETLPFISSFPAPPDETVMATYKRQQITGFEWETIIDQIGFRGEIAYIDKVSFLKDDLTSQRHAVSHLVTGIDYTSASEWYFNLQTSWYKVFNYEKELLFFEEDNLSLLGEIRKTVWRGNLEFSTKFNYTITDQSSYLQPALNLKYFPNTDIEFGAMIFNGDGNTLLGSYDKADQVYAVIKVSF